MVATLDRAAAAIFGKKKNYLTSAWSVLPDSSSFDGLFFPADSNTQEPALIAL
jgi:hypothetical protein